MQLAAVETCRDTHFRAYRRIYRRVAIESHTAHSARGAGKSRITNARGVGNRRGSDNTDRSFARAHRDCAAGSGDHGVPKETGQAGFTDRSAEAESARTAREAGKSSLTGAHGIGYGRGGSDNGRPRRQARRHYGAY